MVHLYTEAVDGESVKEHEATFLGYQPKVLYSQNWKYVSNEAVYPDVSFVSMTNQPLQNIFGAYMTMEVSGDLIWIIPFEKPLPIENSGDQVFIKPSIVCGPKEG